MNRIRLAWLVLPAALAAGCATVPPEEDPVLLKLTELENRIQRIERVVNNDSLLSLSDQLRNMDTELSSLRDSVETTRFEMEGMAKRGRDQYVDLDGRLQKLEQGGGTAAGGAAIAGGAQDQYKAAFDLLQKGDYPAAGERFGAFLEAFPTNPLADNAAYWLAETRYVAGDYGEAIAGFELLLENYPGSQKTADAQLKIGFSKAEMKDWAAAKKALKSVVSTYPGTTAARLAEQRLAQIEANGN